MMEEKKRMSQDDKNISNDSTPKKFASDYSVKQ